MFCNSGTVGFRRSKNAHRLDECIQRGDGRSPGAVRMMHDLVSTPHQLFSRVVPDAMTIQPRFVEG
jgi:hypothetical protein